MILLNTVRKQTLRISVFALKIYILHDTVVIILLKDCVDEFLDVFSQSLYCTYCRCHINCQRRSENAMLMYRNVDLNTVSLKARDCTVYKHIYVNQF
jgi:hypothetical protein